VPRSVAILVNPTAGRGAAGSAAEAVRSGLVAAGVGVQLLRGVDAADGRRQAEDAVRAGVDTLVVVGGDGLVHLAVQCLAGPLDGWRPGRPVPPLPALAIAPSGSGNDIARAFAITRDTEAAVTAVLGGATVPTDVVRVESAAAGPTAGRSSLYLGVACVGFDSRVNARANRMARPRGPSKYTLALFSEIRDVAPVPLTVTVDGLAEQRSVLLTAVGNTAWYGGGMAVAAGAVADDGLLDVVTVDPLRRDQVLALFPRLFSGSHLRLPQVRRRRGRVVTLAIDPAYRGTVPPVFADGEHAADLPVTLTCLPGVLAVHRPRREPTAASGTAAATSGTAPAASGPAAASGTAAVGGAD